MAATSAVSTPRVEQRDDGLALHRDDVGSAFFQFFWLRTACHCERCGDSYTGSRHLQICNIVREQFHQKLRLTSGRLGFVDEAQQPLPAGVSG